MPKTPHAALQQRLLKWYDKHKRDLPWRREPHNAYYQWLAEIMLQQTQVNTAIPYFERFISSFPTVRALAKASLDDVLKHWAGLGYYARARNLHKTSQIVSTQHNGRFPSTTQALQALPGIGRYTAGAISSIAFERQAPILDGNVKRVLARLFAVSMEIDRTAAIQALWAKSAEILPRQRCGDFNQSLMELGATICTPTSPQCQVCPVQTRCQAFATDQVESLPRTSKRAPAKRQTLAVALVTHKQRWLIRKRPLNDLWGGLWELPTLQIDRGQSTRAVLAEYLARLSAQRATIARRALVTVEHQLTHRSLTLKVFHCHFRTSTRPFRSHATRKWTRPEDVQDYALSAAQRKLTRRIAKMWP